MHVHNIIREYSMSEFPDRNRLFWQVKEIKAQLRKYGLFVSDAIKSDITDYNDLRRSNFDKHFTDYRKMTYKYGANFASFLKVPADLYYAPFPLADFDGKPVVIHFYIAFIHPYFDGNGRMARLVHLWFPVFYSACVS